MGVCRARAEKEGSCLFLCTLISQEKAINMFSLGSFVITQKSCPILPLRVGKSHPWALSRFWEPHKNQIRYFWQFRNFQCKSNKNLLYWFLRILYKHETEELCGSQLFVLPQRPHTGESTSPWARTAPVSSALILIAFSREKNPTTVTSLRQVMHWQALIWLFCSNSYTTVK